MCLATKFVYVTNENTVNEVHIITRKDIRKIREIYVQANPTFNMIMQPTKHKIC